MRWERVTDNPDYEVSDTGLVRKGETIVGQWLNHCDYPVVRLSNPRRTVLVHRLVGKAFVPNPDNKPIINHIDFVRSNNNYQNLEWCTQKENLMHSHKHGRTRWNNWAGKKKPVVKNETTKPPTIQGE